MKRFLFLLITTTLIFGCKKYEDGPLLSLRSKKARLCQRWEITGMDENEKPVDLKGFFQSFTFKKGGEFELYTLSDGYQYESRGDWEFNNGKDKLMLSFSSGGYYLVELKKLTKKELTLERVYIDEDKNEIIYREFYKLRD